MVKPYIGPFFPELPRGLEQRKGAVDIGLDEVLGPDNGPVHMAFCGKVNDNADLVGLEQLLHPGMVADITPLEDVSARAEFPVDILEVHQVPCIGQLVVVNDPAAEIRLLQNIADETGSDKACAAGDHDVRRRQEFCPDLIHEMASFHV